MRIKFLFKEEFPSRRKHVVGEVRTVNGQPAFWHDQSRGVTNTRIRKYPCPMTIPLCVAEKLTQWKIQYVYVKLPGEPVTILGASMNSILKAPRHSLGCEPQYFLPWGTWSRLSYQSVILPAEPIERWEVFMFPFGALASKWDWRK